MIGWIGRGVATGLVDFFIVRAAWQFDPNEARGLDRSLREVAGGTIESIVVLACAVGLLAYGIFCFSGHRLRTLDDSP